MSSAPTVTWVRGLPGERTSLAWSRTALSLVVNGGLLLVRDPLGAPLGPLLAGLALLLALVAAVVGRRRVAVLTRSPGAPTPKGAVLALGCAVGALAIAVGLAVLLD